MSPNLILTGHYYSAIGSKGVLRRYVINIERHARINSRVIWCNINAQNEPGITQRTALPVFAARMTADITSQFVDGKYIGTAATTTVAQETPQIDVYNTALVEKDRTIDQQNTTIRQLSRNIRNLQKELEDTKKQLNTFVEEKKLIERKRRAIENRRKKSGLFNYTIIDLPKPEVAADE